MIRFPEHRLEKGANYTRRPIASPTSLNGNRITVPTACRVAPSTLSGRSSVVTVVVVVVGWYDSLALAGVTVVRVVSRCVAHEVIELAPKITKVSAAARNDLLIVVSFAPVLRENFVPRVYNISLSASDIPFHPIEE